MLEYLKRRPGPDEGDLILIVNGFDHWFQLSPQILIDRYHKINEWANKGIESMRKNVTNPIKIEQTVVFGSRRDCMPYVATGERCIPTSKSPSPHTSHSEEEEHPIFIGGASGLHKNQTVPDPSFILGPTREIRLLFERAKEVSQSARGKTMNEQDIFIQIWAEQENQRQNHFHTSTPSSAPNHLLYKSFHPSRRKNYEFSIGLDYTNALYAPPLNSLPDFPFDYLVFANETQLNISYQSHGLTFLHPYPALHPDVAADSLPFSPLAGSTAYSDPQQGYLGPSSTKWEHVPLYTDLWSGITPVIIPQTPPPPSSSPNSTRPGYPKTKKQPHYHDNHINQTTFDAAAESALNLQTIWFRPLTRKLLTAILRQNAATGNSGPIAVEGRIRHGRKWYGAVDRAEAFRDNKDGFGVIMDGRGGGARGWSEVCGGEGEGEGEGEVQEEVFDDGRGVWVWDVPEDSQEDQEEEVEG